MESGAPGGGPAQPSQEELRAQIEEQLRKLRVQDVLLESAVSLLNLAARRIGKADERDLEQARVGIEAVRAVIDLLDEEPARQVRQALDQIQVMYAREASGGGSGDEGDDDAAGVEATPGEGPAEPPSRPPPGLWTPPGS